MLFSHKVLLWYAKNKRTLPWRRTRDPYKIWLSEIMLQQTRIIQGTP
ncbi:MAG: A/G-specific adenine glycosylase, partial [Maribacter sp.]|nr:A/G-specific adenine glycosylase [Maribacter sp.]